jgi:hypothetical protein
MLMKFLSRAFMWAVCRRILIATVALTVWGGTMSQGHAGPLTGSGSHLPLPPFLTNFGIVKPASTEFGNTSFTGTWSGSADASWHGTFTATVHFLREKRGPPEVVSTTLRHWPVGYFR